jgi:predicted dehydrogenase
MLKVGIIGTGAFGEKRAHAVMASCRGRLFGIADRDTEKVDRLGKNLDVPVFSVDDLIEHPHVDVLIVCLPNLFHAPVTIRALQNGKHVLCEKPLARNREEAELMVESALKCNRQLKIGANHRYFSSVQKAYDIQQKGWIGEVISFIGRIGHDGERLKNTWFWNPEISGGGTLLDNGWHLLDIARWMMGNFSEGCGNISRVYWKECPVEDSATGVFLTPDGKMATINSSWRQLSGYFHFEINGTRGYISVDGRFDTHGGNCIHWQSRDHEEKIHTENFGHINLNSYVKELDDFFLDLKNGRNPQPSGMDGLEVIKMIEKVYEDSSIMKTSLQKKAGEN